MNVIVVSIDTLRRDHCGFLGASWIRTPNLDRLAARSVIFERAYLGSYPCMPARRDLYTGRLNFPWKGWGPLEYYDAEIVGIISGGADGVTSQLVTDHYHLFEEGAGNYHFSYTGYDFIRGHEMDQWITDPTVPRLVPRPPWPVGPHPSERAYRAYERNIRDRKGEGDYTGPKVMTRAARWLEENKGLDRFFLMIDCFDPHEPFDPPPEYRAIYLPEYDGPNIVWPNYGSCAHMTDAQVRCVRANYAGKVTMVDKYLGKLLDKVDELGLWKNTMVVLITDHGHMLGEHGVMGKPWASRGDANLYDELARIPFVVHHPENPTPGRRVDAMVQAVDLYPTILEATGRPVPAGAHGRSLLPILRGGEARVDAVRDVSLFARWGESINITDGEWTLFAWPPGESNGPLYWYGQTPMSLRRRVTARPFDGRRFPTDMPRGQMRTALFHGKDDPGQARDRIRTEPLEGERLKRRLRDFLREIDSPPEQLGRLGLA